MRVGCCRGCWLRARLRFAVSIGPCVYVGPSWRLRLYDQSGTHTPQHTDTALTDKDTRDSVTHGGGVAHALARASAVAQASGSGRQIINSRLNNTLYTSKAQALHTWMDPY